MTDQERYELMLYEIEELKRETYAILAELKEYRDLAAEYGIDGKTMLALAKSQIATAKSNCELREELEKEISRATQNYIKFTRQKDRADELDKELSRYQDAEKEGRQLFPTCKPVKQIIHNYGSKSTIQGKKEFTEYRCPTCEIILFARPNFCMKCGTKITWPDEIKRNFDEWPGKEEKPK
jgi:cell division septum initiation protein DivIVA